MDALSWLTWERAAYILLFAVALAMRLWGLGARAMSHDESLHALYSWKLYAGQGYMHDPMMHGPFKFHMTALIYYLFGASDFTARLLEALFGSVLVVLPGLLLRKWMGRAGALVTGVLLAFSPTFLFYSRYFRDDINNMVWAVLMAAALFRFLDERKGRYILMFGVVGILALASMEASYMTGFIFLVGVLVLLVWERLPEAAAKWVRWIGLAVCAVGIPLAIWLTQRRPGGLSPAVTPPPADFPLPTSTLQYFTLLMLFLTGAVLAGFAWKAHREERLVAKGLSSIRPRTILWTLAAVLVIFVLLYTTFFTHPRPLQGLYSGAVAQIKYWVGEHKGGAGRGGQPWYYILMLLSIYEFLPLLGAVTASIYYAFIRRKSVAERDGLPFVPFLIFWTFAAAALHSWGGEKMPQHSMYPLLPMILLTGRLAQDWIGDVDWKEAWKKGAAFFAVLLPVAAFIFVRLFMVRPFSGMSLQRLSSTFGWVVTLLALAALVWILYKRVVQMGKQLSLQATAFSILLILFLATVRFAWMASYVNYDLGKEFLVYAHGTPDVKLTMNEIAEISRRTVGGNLIKVAYDDETTWPLEWYLREFPNRVYYGKQPSPDALDAPIVLVGSPNENQVKPFLANKYERFPRRHIWFPTEDYKGLTLNRVVAALRDPMKRQEIWDILWSRKYKQNANGFYAYEFAMYVRKDIAAQMWTHSIGTLPTQPEPVEDVYLKKNLVVASVMQVGYSGQGEGQFADPRGVAVDAQGNVHVADTNNHRIQVFDSNGAFLRQWGAQGDGDGQFNEPWGIAVDGDGNVYVADTWNHRIQKFDKNGKFLAKWGEFRDSQGTTELEQGHFYGPRALAVALDGTLLVVDTGNERVERFGSDGKFLGAYGGFGAEDGQFWEPVGIAVDGDGNVYIADTWNQRVQKFDKDFRYVTKWGINTWVGQSVVNKPCLAADSRGHVYASDPEGYRLLEFTGDGEFVASYGQYGSGIGDFNLPIGLCVDAGDSLWVADSGNHRIMKFGPLGR